MDNFEYLLEKDALELLGFGGGKFGPIKSDIIEFNSKVYKLLNIKLKTINFNIPDLKVVCIEMYKYSLYLEAVKYIIEDGEDGEDESENFEFINLRKYLIGLQLTLGELIDNTVDSFKPEDKKVIEDNANKISIQASKKLNAKKFDAKSYITWISSIIK